MMSECLGVDSQVPLPYALLNPSCNIRSKISCTGLYLHGRLRFQSWLHRTAYRLLSSAMLSCSRPTKLQREFSSWIWAEVSESGQQRSLESGEFSADF